MITQTECCFVRYTNDAGSLWGVLYIGMDGKPRSVMTDAEYDYVKSYCLNHLAITIPVKDSQDWIVKSL